MTEKPTTRRRAALALGGALGVALVLGTVLGTRAVTEDLADGVRTALVEAGADDVGAEVSGREVRLDPGTADPAQVERARPAVEALEGVRRVEVVTALPAEDVPAEPAVVAPPEPDPTTEPAREDTRAERDPRDEDHLPDTGRPAEDRPE